MKRAIFAILFTLACTCTNHRTLKNTPYEQLWNCVFKVKGFVIDNFQPYAYSGSAVVIGHRQGYTIMLTAKHLIHENAAMSVEVNGKEHKVVNYILHLERDLAIIKVEGVFGDVAYLWNRDPVKPGTPAWNVGFPLGMKLMNAGYITGVTDDHYILYSTGTIFGSSGSPIFVKHKNRWYIYGIASKIPITRFGAVEYIGMAEPWYYAEHLINRIDEMFKN